MAMFGRQQRGPTVRGRAYVVPTSTGNVGSGEEANFNNLRSKSRAKSATRLVLRSAEDGGSIPTESQRVIVDLPNWLRFVMHDAGTNHGCWEQLPAEIDVPVWVDQQTREIVSLDVEGAARELEQYRAVGTREWKETEAVLAPVRGAIKLPGMVARGVPALAKDWGGAIRELREDFKAGAPMRDEPLSAKELDQQRRTATALRYQLEQNPKQHRQIRDGVVEHGPSMAAGVTAGSYPSHAFAAWVVFQETSGVITADEAAEFRRTAGVPLDGSPPISPPPA